MSGGSGYNSIVSDKDKNNNWRSHHDDEKPVTQLYIIPLTNVYVGNPSTTIWVLVRTVLALVGLASITLFWALLTLHGKVPGVSYWLAVVGSGYFAFHTTILDAVVWAALFK